MTKCWITTVLKVFDNLAKRSVSEELKKGGEQVWQMIIDYCGSVTRAKGG